MTVEQAGRPKTVECTEGGEVEQVLMINMMAATITGSRLWMGPCLTASAESGQEKLGTLGSGVSPLQEKSSVEWFALH